MTAKNSKKAWNCLKFRFNSKLKFMFFFWSSLITILLSDFRNSEWQNQYGRKNFGVSVELAQERSDWSTQGFQGC